MTIQLTESQQTVVNYALDTAINSGIEQARNVALYLHTGKRTTVKELRSIVAYCARQASTRTHKEGELFYALCSVAAIYLHGVDAWTEIKERIICKVNGFRDN